MREPRDAVQRGRVNETKREVVSQVPQEPRYVPSIRSRKHIHHKLLIHDSSPPVCLKPRVRSELVLLHLAFWRPPTAAMVPPRGSGQTIVKTDCIWVPSELVQRRLIFVSFPFWNGPSACPVTVMTSPA